MRSKRNIRLAVSVFIAIAMALILPGISIAGSLDPPSYAADGSGNPVPTTQPKIACRGAFWDNADGTVADCKTGLVWMQNANCFGFKDWNNAKESCAALASGTCGLSDGSSAGDWHLPTIEELKTLPDKAYGNPALSNEKGDAVWTEGDAFTGVQSGRSYWSSTALAGLPSSAWDVSMSNGIVHDDSKAFNNYVWCVRRGN